jgi:nitroreductase
MAAGDTARLYHRLSSYSYVPGDGLPPPIDHPLVVQDFVSLDYARIPSSCKAYPPGLPTVELPRDWPRVPLAATAVLAGQTTVAPASLDLPGLARLLHLSAGVVRFKDDWHGRRLLFRAAGSAGGRFPLEVYVSALGVPDVPDGVHWYDPVGHALVQVGPPADGEATTLIATGVPWRTGWKYAERSFRHVYWDAGSMLAQALALAESAGFDPRLWTRFSDAEVSRLVGADGVHEFPVALVGLGTGEPAIRPRGDAARGDVDSAPIEFPLVTLAQHAGDEDRLGDPWPARPPMPGDVPPSTDLDAVILQRGSTRVMDPTAAIAREVYAFSVAASLRFATVPHFIAVHGVDGVDQGLYRWPDLVHPLRREPLREVLLAVCWDQNLGRDAAFDVVAALDLETIDDRGYREAQLEAGIVEGRLHLAAFALGIGACGMTFLDDEIEGLLREPLAGLLITCVGVPAYANKRGGGPGEPVSITMPSPGDTPRMVSPS